VVLRQNQVVLKLVWWYSYLSYATSVMQTGYHGKVEGYPPGKWLFRRSGL
jgi:hypothetical protein